MPTGNQRRGQAWIASENIKRAARRIAEEREIPLNDAISVVFADAELLAKCHQVPKAEAIAKDWAEPQ
jgi:hypothetical protein